jgi:hypothetical protein
VTTDLQDYITRAEAALMAKSAGQSIVGGTRERFPEPAAYATELRRLCGALGIEVPDPPEPPEESRALATGGIFGLIGRISNLGLTPNQVAVYVYFVGCRNRATGQAWQGMRLIAKHTGMSLSTVQEARDILIAAGLLEPAGRRADGRRPGRESNSYRVHLPTKATLETWRRHVAAAREAARLARKSRESARNHVPPSRSDVPPSDPTYRRGDATYRRTFWKCPNPRRLRSVLLRSE